MRNTGKINKFLGAALFVAGFSAGLFSCTSEQPFKVENEGNALVRFNVSANEALTRDSENDLLAQKCVLYIANETGLLHKWEGLNNIPTNGVYLRYGNYTAEALAGDSVPASFTSRYFKGLTNFEITSNLVSSQVTIECKIANVVVSVDASSISPELIKTLKVDVNSSTGGLTYEDAELSSLGYFMMAYNDETKSYENKLSYTVSGLDIDGSSFSLSGEISNVLPAHQYELVLKKDEFDKNIGGVALKLEIREYELIVDETVIIHGKPEFMWHENDLDIDRQLYNKEQSFTDKVLYVGAFDGFKSIVLSTDNSDVKQALADFANIDVVNSEAGDIEKLQKKGIIIQNSQKGLYGQYQITLTAEWLNAFIANDEEYVLKIAATDKRGMSNEMKVRIATSENALEAPFVINTDFWKKDLLSIKAHSAVVPVTLFSEVENLVVRYKKSSEEEWTELEPISSQKAEDRNFALNNLEQNTLYDVQLLGGTITEGKYQFQSSTETFKTEEEFKLPNSSMENWYKTGKYFVPMPDSSYDFWDTGNSGSTTISSNDNLTVQFTDFYKSGNSCAALTSKFVGIAGIGKHGAASLFTGSFAGTEKTTHGIIDLGREYNQSHPKALRVWVNYRPKTADKGANDSYIKKGELDKGQIYIALSTEVHRARTAEQSTLITETNLPSTFIAYGQRTFEKDFGEDRTLEEVVIDFDYFDSAKTNMPKYLIILCAASKYGDYFSGGEGSTMYVDDFELIYE